MSTTKTYTQDESSENYDRLARKYSWYSPEVLFGLCFEYIQPSERLLDIGIGTGLGSFPFAKAGLLVSGLDISLEMLNIVRSKGITADLKQFDIRVNPWPYPDGFFDHMVACGVLHFMDDLTPIFLEAARVLKPGGILAFSTKAPPVEDATAPGIYSTEIICNVTVFLHHIRYITALMAECGFKTLKHMVYVDCVDETGRRDPYNAWVNQKK